MSKFLLLGRNANIFSGSARKTKSLARPLDLIRIENWRERRMSKIDELLFPSFCVYE